MMTVRIMDTEAVDSVEATVTSVVSVEVLVAEVGDQAAFGGDSDFPNRGCPYVPMYRYTAYISYRCSCATLFLALLSVGDAAAKFHGIVNVSSAANDFVCTGLDLSSLFAALCSFVLPELLLDPFGKSAAAPAIASW